MLETSVSVPQASKDFSFGDMYAGRQKRTAG
jgi:hypothetical protein